MERNTYWMEGEFTLEDEKKKNEMNALIMEVLRKTGIRKLSTMNVSGKELPVAEIPTEDKDGIVRYDYSIFEQKIRERNSYNTRTCELEVSDPGGNEFALATNVIMTILESYSETPYYLMMEDELCYIQGYAMILECLTGVALKFKNREKVFNCWFTIRSRDMQSKISVFNVIDNFPSLYGCFDNVQLMTILISGKIIEPGPKATDSLIYDIEFFIYESMELMKKTPENKEKYWDYIIYLLDLNLEARKKEAQRDNELTFLAKGSVRVPSPYLVKVYAEAYGQDFIQLWGKINKEGYWDIDHKFADQTDCIRKREAISKNCFKECIMRDYDDDFVELGDKDELILSDELEENIHKWVDDYNSYAEKDYHELDIEKTLSEIMYDMHEIWNCKPLNRQLVEDILEHKTEEKYKRAVYQLKRLIEEEIAYFAELPDSYIKKYILKKVRIREWRRYYSAYTDLLTNVKQREVLFGF